MAKRAKWVCPPDPIPFVEAVAKCVDDSGAIRVPLQVHKDHHSVKLYYLFPQVDTDFGRLRVQSMDDIRAMHPLMVTTNGIILPANLTYVELDTPVEYYTWSYLMFQWASMFRPTFERLGKFNPEEIESEEAQDADD